MMQKELKTKGKLLDEKGHLIECGYAKSLIKNYDRKDIKAGKLRIKEWDYYLIYNDDYGVALTIDDNSYMGLYSISFLDFKNATETTKSPMTFMPKGKTNMPSTSEIGDVAVENKNYKFSFLNDGKTRKLFAYLKNFKDGKDITIEFSLTDEPKDSMVIITPFKNKPKHFYYNQKIVGLKATGKVVLGEKEIIFDKNTRAILDWGRGVWTYKNTWCWLLEIIKTSEFACLSSIGSKSNSNRLSFDVNFHDDKKSSFPFFFFGISKVTLSSLCATPS